MESYLMLIASAVLLAVTFTFNKLYQSRRGTSLGAGFGFNALLGIFTAAVFFCINGFTLTVSPFSLLLAFGLTSLCIAHNLLGFRVMKSGSMSLYILFLMTGGMTVPYVWGLVFLSEPFSPWRTAGLVLIIGAIVLANLPSKQKKTDLPTLGMCLFIFFLNGFVSVFSKLHQIEEAYRTVDATEFVLLGGLCKFILAGICWLIFRKKTSPDRSVHPLEKRSLLGILLIILGAATADGISFLLQLLGAAELPATVLYPFVTGGSILFTTLADRIFFKTKIALRLIAANLLCFAATLLFL